MADLRAGPRPDEVASKTFSTSFRGFDPPEVRGYLAEVAAALAVAASREAALRDELARSRATLAKPALDEAVLLGALGEEAARVLHTAKEAAADIRTKADANAATALDRAHSEAERLLAEAQAAAERLYRDAEGVLAVRTGEAGEVARLVIVAAEQEAARLRDSGLTEARSMVAEARAVRERMLGDLKRRLQRGEATIEVLRVGRERLLEAFGVVKDRLDDASHALATAEARARTEAGDEAEEAGIAAAAVVDRLVLMEPATESLSALPDEERLAVRSVEAEGQAAAEGPLAIPADEVHTGEPSGEVAEVVPIGGAIVVEDDEAAPTPLFDSPAAAPSTGEVPVIAATGTDSGGVGRGRRRMLRLADEPAVRAEEQRLSQMRYLHRPRTGGEPEVHLPEDGMVVVEPPSAGEGVRLLRQGEWVREPQGRAPTNAPDAGPQSAVSLVGPVQAAPARTVVTERAATTTPAPPAACPPAAAPPVVAHPAEVTELPAASSEPTAPGARPDAAALFARLRAERGRPATTPSKPVPAPVDDDELALQARDAAMTPVEHLLAKKVKRLLQDHQNEVLDRLRAKRPPTSLELLGEVEDLLGPLAAAAQPLLGDAAQAGAASAGAPDTPVPSADLAQDIAANVIKDLRPRLEQAYSVVDPERRAERVNVAFREWRGERVGRLVADAAHAAFARGQFLATPPGKAMRWVADDGEHPCAECEGNSRAGSTAKGTVYPSGHRHPPAHSGCRCLLAAVIGRSRP